MEQSIWLFGLLGIAGSWAAAVALGRWRWAARTKALRARLPASDPPELELGFEPDLDELPEVVQSFLRASLPPARASVLRARFVHEGRFNLGGTEAKWRRFRSEQWVTAVRPGFVWSAKIRFFPLFPVLVHDAYVGGRGVLEARLLGLLSVMSAPDTAELSRGELLRWLAEAAWYPTALLPGAHMRWEPVDANSARAVVTDGTVVAQAIFRFEEGRVVSVRTEDRPRETPDGPVPTPWQGRFWNHERRDGFLIPLEGEVAWELEGTLHPYWQGRLLEARFRCSGSRSP